MLAALPVVLALAIVAAMKATARHSAAIEELSQAILGVKALTPLDQRAAAVAGEPTGTAADAYLANVRTQSHRLVDADVDGLRAIGMSEDAVFQLTVCAAFGEAFRRLDEGLATLAMVESELVGRAS